MTVREGVPLADLTTLRVGGAAAYVAECESINDVQCAIAFAHDRNLSFRVLGQGSNVLASDDGFAGVVLILRSSEIVWEEQEDETLVTADAGVAWETLVDHAAARGLWGIENLAGIPGTVGAAPVQNIGAYGAELKDTFVHAYVLNTTTGACTRMDKEACRFGYRESIFKHDDTYVILSVTLRLAQRGTAHLTYGDLARAREQGTALTTPSEVVRAVRTIRSEKFPDLSTVGTAGSFFKNPVISEATYQALAARYKELPRYAAHGGVKIPLAFILDHVLGLKGYAEGPIGLFVRQPLVLTAAAGATAHDIDAFAKKIEQRVRDAIGIVIEREVRSW